MRILIILLFLIPVVFALEDCKEIIEPREVPCMVVSTWNYTPPCAQYNVTVWNSSGENIVNYTMGSFGNSLLCNFTFNISEEGSYNFMVTNGDTGNILVESEDNMTSLAVILFLGFLNILLFVVPIFVRFVKDDGLNNIVKKMIWLVGLVILAFNITILATLADNAGLGITHEIFVFQDIVLWGLFIGMIFLMWNAIISTMKIWRIEKQKKRMGEE